MQKREDEQTYITDDGNVNKHRHRDVNTTAHPKRIIRTVLWSSHTIPGFYEKESQSDLSQPSTEIVWAQ